MKKRYCDICKLEIKPNTTFIKLVRQEYKKDNKFISYPTKSIGDMCLNCLDKLTRN